MIKVVISLLTFNSSEETKKCLLSIDKVQSSDISLSIVVIDNGSEIPFTVQKDFLKNIPVTILRQEKNYGFGVGHNIGIDFALVHGADYIIILNNDTVLSKETVRVLVEAMENDKTVGVAVPKIYFVKGREYHTTEYKKEELGKVFWYAGGYMDWKNVIGKHRGVDETDNGQYDIMEDTEEATGCCMIVRREVFKKAGKFSNKYFLYYEDADISEKIKKAGYHILYVPKAVLWHKNAASTGGSGSPLQDYYISRNRLIFGMQYASLRTKAALIRESMRLLITGRRWQKKGIMDFYLHKYGKGSYT